MSVPAWELRSITKRFPGVVANHQVSLCINAGQIQGLLGENGSGKSTLIKILSGVHQPDDGTMLRNGELISLPNPTIARKAGIATVFQEFSLVQSLSVAENIHLGRPIANRIGIDWATMRKNTRDVLAQMDVAIDPDYIVGSLSVAEQQLVEIAKTLVTNASLLILDEPTTALGRDEIIRLHTLLRRLKARGAAVLYISHRLDEVVELVDRVTVLKDGRVVERVEGTQISVPNIVRMMVGELGDHYPKQHNAGAKTVLEVRNLRTNNRVNGVSFTVRSGEVFGLGGVLGSGRTEIARALFGLDPVTKGEIICQGVPQIFRSPRDAIRCGIAFVPENRKFDGLFFNLTGLANISIAALRKLGRRGLISHRKEALAGKNLIKALAISPRAETQEVGLLSGGNQQKIVIARWLFANTTLFILDEPTQGIDIAARVAVYDIINRITSEGKSVILISSDHDELLRMSDRIGLIRHGTIVAIKPAASVTKEDLVQSAAITGVAG